MYSSTMRLSTFCGLHRDTEHLHMYKRDSSVCSVLHLKNNEHATNYGGVVHGASCPWSIWDKLSMGQAVHGASCPGWGKLSWARCLFGKLFMAHDVMACCHGTNFHGASIHWAIAMGRVVWESLIQYKLVIFFFKQSLIITNILC